MPRKPKKTKADIVALVEAALTADLPLQTGRTVAPPEPAPPVPEPLQPEPIKSQAEATEQTPKAVKKHLRRIETRVVGDTHVHLIDTGYPNRAVGVQLEFADPQERPSETVKRALKEERQGNKPLSYKPEYASWLKRTGEMPVADRLDAEMRFADAVEALRAEKTVDGPSR